VDTKQLFIHIFVKKSHPIFYFSRCYTCKKRYLIELTANTIAKEAFGILCEDTGITGKLINIFYTKKIGEEK